MPYLGDYLGQLLSEISMARMQADLETVRIAELYATHPLLRTMPIPHMRLPNIDLDIPVLIKSSEAPREGESARGGITLAEMRRKFDDVLDVQLAKTGMRPSVAERQKLRNSLDEKTTTLGSPSETAIDVSRVAEELSAAAAGVIAGFGLPVGVDRAAGPTAADLKESARLEFLRSRKPPPRLSVLVTSTELRETGTPDSIIRLRLKVSEQGVEWTTVDSDGVIMNRLIPE